MTSDSSSGKPSVFLSYAVLDHRECHILTRLKAQPVQVWNNQALGEQIAFGEDIEAKCKQRIDQSSVFVLLLSRAAFESTWVKVELIHALDRKDAAPMDLFVIVDKDVESTTNWAEPFRQLKGTMNLPVDFSATAGIESAVFEICNRLKVKYTPPPLEDPRFPFMTLLFEEFGNVLGESPYEAALYDSLLRILMDFHEAFAKGDYPQSAAHLDYFIQIAKHEYRKSTLWYPYILRAVCDCLQDNYAEALERLSQINVPTSIYPRPSPLRSTVCATIGYVHYQQGEFGAAVDSYSRALEEYPNDTANQCNLAVASLEAGIAISKAKAFAAIDGCSVLAGDKPQTEVMKARVCALTGNEPEARTRFEALVKTGEEEAYLVEPYAQFLCERSERDRARELLRACVKSHPSEMYARLFLAKLHEECGDSAAASKEFSRIGQQCTKNAKMQFQVLRGLWSIQYRKEALGLANDILAQFTVSPPADGDEFLAAGAANWIMGNLERAEYDFERSRKPKDPWHYSRYLSN
jgi:tetratricopeptide (TPR) repeat protein